jgi:hypothetical protein
MHAADALVNTFACKQPGIITSADEIFFKEVIVMLALLEDH